MTQRYEVCLHIDEACCLMNNLVTLYFFILTRVVHRNTSTYIVIIVDTVLWLCEKPPRNGKKEIAKAMILQALPLLMPMPATFCI